MKTSTSRTLDTKPAVLICGPPGTGKTVLTLCFPRPYVIEIDNNLDGPMKFLADRKLLPLVKYDMAHLDDEDKLLPPDKVWMTLGRRLNAAMRDPTIDTIVIDSLTALVDLMMDEVRRVTIMSGDQNAPKLADATKADLFTESPQERPVGGTYRIQDWGTFLTFCRKFFTKLRLTNKLVVVTAHIDLDKLEGSTVYQHFIKVPSSYKNEIAGQFTDCWYTEIETRNKPTGQNSATQEAVWTITTVPMPGMKALGLKSCLGLKPKQDVDLPALIKLLASTQPIKP